MEEEEWKIKLEKFRKVWQGHCGVLTKLTKDIKGLVVSTEPKPNWVSHMKITYEQMEGKMRDFSKHDGDIADLCVEEDIEWEIIEAR